MPAEASDDRRQERELAGLIFSSSEAAEAFIAACAIEARAILRRHADVFDALTSALLEQRTIDGAQIDEVIARAVAASHLKQERQRRRDWQNTVARASEFEEEECRGSGA
jgi:uroporphyrinogen-III synthase